MLRNQVVELINLGPLPNSDADPTLLKVYEDMLASIIPPVTDEEAKRLVKMFGEDDCYGLAWTLLHLIETAPSWPLWEYLEGEDEWIIILRGRAKAK
jgi:hypothetical protein